MMNDFEEDLDDVPSEKQRITGRIYGWSIGRGVDGSIHSRKWDQNEDSTFLMEERPI